MDMKIIKSEKRICSCCMEEHEVKTVLVKEQTIFKNRKIDYYINDELLIDFPELTEDDAIEIFEAYQNRD